MTDIKLRLCVLVCCLLWAVASFAAPKKMRICAQKCQTPACKKLAQEVEFEFELLPDYLLPPCKSASAPLAKKEFRLVFLEHKRENQVEVELDCLETKICLSQKYKGKELTAKIVSDVRAAIKQNKPLPEETEVAASLPVSVQAPKGTPKEAPKEALPQIAQTEEWDRIVVPLPQEMRVQAAQTAQANEHVAAIQRDRRPTSGSATLSFGGENWNYAFDSDRSSERIGSVHSRIYPKVTLSATFWINAYVRLSAIASASIAGLRIKANQPVEGDGSIVLTQMYQGMLLAGVYKGLGDLVHLGADVGYDFQGVFVAPQQISERTVTVAPSFQGHGLRLGPRVILGNASDTGMLDVSAGFYPYHYYEESPDEPTIAKRLFSWSLHGVARLMLSNEIYADASLRAQVFHVHYTDDAVRQTADGEKWGAGRVTNVSTSAMVGLGWLF